MVSNKISVVFHESLFILTHHDIKFLSLLLKYMDVSVHVDLYIMSTYI